MKKYRFETVIIVLSIALGLSASAAALEKDHPVELTSLAESLAPLVEHFNSQKGSHRFVALLSPT